MNITITEKKIDDLSFYEHNAKIHPREQIELIKASITEFGWRNPILISGDGTIICGHGRVIAALELGMAEVPCISADDLTPAQMKAYRILDNKSAESDWDFDFLKLDFEELAKDGFDMELTGFNPDEIDNILEIPTNKVYDEKEVDENLDTDNECPKCGYRW